MPPDLIYTAQFEALSVWLGTLRPGELTFDSALPGWTVADLIGHLAGIGQSISELRPAGDALQPMSIASYVSRYRPSSDLIAQAAVAVTRSVGPDSSPLHSFYGAHAAAQYTVERLGAVDQVVQTRRGPMMLADFLDTAVIELVVHAGDLGRSLPHRRPPVVLPSAQRRVLGVLRELLTEKADRPVEAIAAASALPPADFIELAAGRTVPGPDVSPALAAALPLF